MSASSDNSPGAPRNGGFMAPYVTYVRAYFTQRSIHPDQLPEIMFKHIYTGAMGNIWGTLIAGVFLVYFGNKIGITKFEWGVMSAIVSLMLLMEVLSAGLTQRLGHRKLLWFLCATADRSLRFIGIMISLLLWHFGMPYAGPVLIMAIAIATCLGAMAGPPWLSWLTDLIPEKEHSEFWGRRSAWASLAILCTMLPAALFIDHLPENLKLTVTMWIFTIATVIGLLDLVIHGSIPEPAMARLKDRGYRQHLMTPLRDREFRPFLVFNFMWTFAAMVGATLFMVFIMKDLGGDKHLFGTALATTGAYLIGAVLFAKPAGILIDRAGAKVVMRWGYLFWAMIPVTWFFFTPGNVLWICGILNFVAGFGVAAAMNANMKIQTRYPPPAHRAMYIAVSNCANYTAAGLAGLVAALLAYWLEGWSWTTLGMHFVLFDVFAIISLILRLYAALFLIKPIRERPTVAAA